MKIGMPWQVEQWHVMRSLVLSLHIHKPTKSWLKLLFFVLCLWTKLFEFALVFIAKRDANWELKDSKTPPTYASLFIQSSESEWETLRNVLIHLVHSVFARVKSTHKELLLLVLFTQSNSPRGNRLKPPTAAYNIQNTLLYLTHSFDPISITSFCPNLT